ncbi:hypothetical protein ElyMa_000375800, partial [Elysia marginata]
MLETPSSFKEIDKYCRQVGGRFRRITDKFVCVDLSERFLLVCTESVIGFMELICLIM